jgi:hypothetical protein
MRQGMAVSPGMYEGGRQAGRRHADAATTWTPGRG